MRHALNLKGSEFYVVQDIFDHLLELPEGWRVVLGDGVNVRVSSDKKKERVKVSGLLAGVRFTLTINRDSGFLIANQQCKNIEAYVHDIVTLLRGGMKLENDKVALATEEEAQDWIKRCAASADHKKLVKNIRKMPRAKDAVPGSCWIAGKYRMGVRKPEENDPLFNSFVELYGGDVVALFYSQEYGKQTFYLVVRDDALYYDPDRQEYFTAIYPDLERLTTKFVDNKAEWHGDMPAGFVDHPA
jgi:hypothetical protein